MVDQAAVAEVTVDLKHGALEYLAKEIEADQLVRKLVLHWVAAVVLSYMFTSTLAAAMPPSLGPLLSTLFAFLVIFIGAWVVSAFIGLILGKIVQAAGLGWTDH